MLFYGVEGAGAGNDLKTKSALSAVPFMVHVASDRRDAVLDNLKDQGIIDEAQYNDIKTKGKIGLVAIAALSSGTEGADKNFNISLMACEQLELLAKVAGYDGTSDFSDAKYSDMTGRKLKITLADGREINVVTSSFVK